MPPQPSQSGSRRRISWPLIAMALVTVVALVGVAYVLLSKDRGEGEVLLQSVASEGPFPWTPSAVPADAPTSVPPAPPGMPTLPPAAPTVADGQEGLTPVAGDQPGLYGGSNELGVCDKEKLISFLENQPRQTRGLHRRARHIGRAPIHRVAYPGDSDRRHPRDKPRLRKRPSHPVSIRSASRHIGTRR